MTTEIGIHSNKLENNETIQKYAKVNKIRQGNV